ncbi:THAP domain-containing protein 5 isoform X1 [Anomaloglossus baeobatrachus]|uniref:THAP domain-containing protein 5 isoform X1 n=2 Tax=Anomaloglossus baeobatrachus TaxID=238106 RepID=UPI003F503923
MAGKQQNPSEMPTCQTMTYELHHASSLENMPLEEPLAEPSDTLHRCNVYFSNEAQTSDNSLVFPAIKHTIEQQGSAEESVITIIVPEDIAKKTSILPILQDHHFTHGENLDVEHISSNDSDTGDEFLEMEHSYCRHDRKRLRKTITKLQAKIALLEVQENVTLGRLSFLEELIGQLKEENLLSDEKLKILDNCQKNF